ncbi:latent transforming growth factor beta-binding protein [Corallococcus exercitus]|nr:latent transforming growth factor beta-binding protein [Corallococcus exercitus]
MRCPFPFLLVLGVLLVGPGCPLDIQVREEPDAGCSGDSCTLACAADRECPAGQRCNDFYDECEPGPRITEPCADNIACSGIASCKDGRCARRCSVNDCPLGYQCSPGPESLCVETCEGLTPENLGRFCASSMECTRCGLCTDSGGGKKCHQPCRSDAECPDARPGVCVVIPGSTLRVCQQ